MPVRLRAYTQAHLPIHIAIVGGGLAGLTTALALTRVGHRVTVFEQHAEDAPLPSGGVRIPPNQSKILARWGLKEDLAKITVVSKAWRVYTYAHGEFLGKHAWDQDVLRECGGEWMFASYVDLRALILSAARGNGADIRFSTKVESVDKDEAKLTLENGDVFSADVIVGADGSKSVMRDMVFKGAEQTQDTGITVFNMTVPLAEVEADPNMEGLLEDGSVSLWLGNGCYVHGFPMRSGKYALHFYARFAGDESIPDYWGTPAVSPSTLLSAIGDVEPRLQRLVSLASPISAVRYRRHQEIEDEEDWVLPSSLGSVLGDAAHPTPPACVQASAMAFEDAAVFAKLFSHMRRPDQAPSLLSAFASLRADRVRKTLEADIGTFMYFMMPYGEDGIAKARDESFRAATKAGTSLTSDESAQEQWETTLATWVYDAEDDADNWWVEWGALGERSKEAPRALAFDFEAAISTVDVQAEIRPIEVGM